MSDVVGTMNTVEAAATDLYSLCESIAKYAKAASYELASISGAVKNAWLRECANRINESNDAILRANATDLELAPSYGLTHAAIDRLTLTPARIRDIANGLTEVAALPDPVGEIIEGSTRPNGLRVSKVRVPIGVLFFIYESRPNVTADAAAIAIKSGNAIILRGGKESFHSSRAIVEVMQNAGQACGIPEHAVQLVPTKERDAVGHFLSMASWIDLVIPRGGEGLVRRVTKEAAMPVLKHFDGNCHVYVDAVADFATAIRIIVNSKCQRMGVCNAMESLVVHQNIAQAFLPLLEASLQPHGIELRGDEIACRILKNAVVANEDDWSREYLGPVMSIRVVESLDEAIAHINRYSSKHTEAIVTTSLSVATRFTQRIDSSAVVVNASTRFNDGGQLGLGAEIGISTDKLHARGPCGLRELTTYKYIIHGDGQIRE